ncbi:MAG: HD domain-containing protein [Elusimicrobia bacterium]|nr:HD domain-containing protein [Elusimicrobiota bacterium]
MKQILKLFLNVFNKESYIVGGALRDILLNRPLTDIDIAVPNTADLEKKLKFIAKKKSLSFFPLDKKEKTYRMILKKPFIIQMDISAIKEKSIIADLKARDFTINSMAYPLTETIKLSFKAVKRGMEKTKKGTSLKIKGLRIKKVIDPTNGIKDLKNKKIIFSNPAKAIKDDPLRMLRAFRIASQLDFTIDGKSLSEIKKQSPKILKSSSERIHDELMLILKNPHSLTYIKSLFECGLLLTIFPDLKAQIECAEEYYGKGGVLKHTFKVIERMEYFFENADIIIPYYKEFPDFSHEKEILKMIALLHDVAKPPKAAFVKGRLRFFGHEEYGAIMSERIMKQLRFSNNHIKIAYSAIAHHLRVGNLASNNNISERAIFRFFRDMGDNAFYLLILCWADHSSYISLNQLSSIIEKIKQKPFFIGQKGLPKTGITKTLRFLQVVNLLFSTYIKKTLKLKESKLINGKDIMKTLKIKESPLIGRILNNISMLHFEGKIKTRKDAIDYLKKQKELES